jgi:hypothetical protein
MDQNMYFLCEEITSRKQAEKPYISSLVDKWLILILGHLSTNNVYEME